MFSFAQLLWFFAWLVAAAYAVFQIHDVITDYLEYKSITKYTIEDRSIPMPAITVCIMNPLKWANVFDWINGCNRMESDGSLLRICEKYSLHLNGSSAFRPKNDQPWLRDLQFDLIDAGFEDRVLKLSYPIDDLFHQDITRTNWVWPTMRYIGFIWHRYTGPEARTP